LDHGSYFQPRSRTDGLVDLEITTTRPTIIKAQASQGQLYSARCTKVLNTIAVSHSQRSVVTLTGSDVDRRVRFSVGLSEPKLPNGRLDAYPHTFPCRTEELRLEFGSDQQIYFLW